MFRETSKHLARKHLDKQLQSLNKVDILKMPTRGWIYTIRTTIGMTQSQLGKRLGISAQAVAQLEQREVGGKITLTSLKQALAALGVQGTHTVLSPATLEQIIHNQATKKAREIVLRTSQTMQLEGQKNSEKRLKESVKETTILLESTIPSTLWD